MLAPLSWLKEYVPIKLSAEKLGERLTEIGLGTEKILKEKNDTVFELEITPNRPDLLSIIGVAREIAAIEKTTISYPTTTTTLQMKKGTQALPLTIKTDVKISPRFTGIILTGITVSDSPKWLQERLIQIGQRPINNIVDITNYVMFELGNPIHAFDYDKISGNHMTIDTAKNGEEFKSVDGITYHLPKGAVIIRDSEKIIDLCGIKGGYNSGTFTDTKTIVLHIPVELPVLIRRASTALSLRSVASSIFERGVNAGGTLDALKRVVDLILKHAGGEIASEIYDIKEKAFDEQTLTLRLERLSYILGITIPETTVIKILESLNLRPKVMRENTLQVTIPTYRNDLKIEEDLIEEVARIYGYNNFPKTLPIGQIPNAYPPYYKDFRVDEMVKELFVAAGFTEIQTYSLIGETDLQMLGVNSEHVLRVDNAVSRDFEYLRPSLKANILKAIALNVAYTKAVHLFELGKIYRGKTLADTEETFMLCGMSTTKDYREIKGVLEKLLDLCNIKDFPYSITIEDQGVYFEINYTKLLEKRNTNKKFVPVPKYPPLREDMAFITPKTVKVGDIIETITKQSPLITDVSLLDEFDQTKTFHIVYQHDKRNLTSNDIVAIREKIIQVLRKEYDCQQKEE